MGKNQKTELGRALVKQHNQMIQQTKEKGKIYKKKFLESFTEVSDIDAIIEQADEDVDEQQLLDLPLPPPTALINLDHASGSGFNGLTVEEMKKEQKIEEALHASSLRVPRRPFWSAEMSADELHANETQHFLTWRRSLARLEENKKLVLTPFEKNLDIWRQLWRVVERSDLLVMVVDSRDPLFYRCPDLEAYAKEVDVHKNTLLLVNKADLLPASVREKWAEYFRAHGILFIFWSAKAATAVLEGKKLGLSQADNMASANNPDTKIYGRDELLARLQSEAEAIVDMRRSSGSSKSSDDNASVSSSSSHVVVGFVGYPNVGKSSTINALVGQKKTGVTSTPGKTKHFQTLIISEKLTLCDCPGLVFPSFSSSRYEMITCGVLPIDRMTQHRECVQVVANRVPRHVIEEIYNISLPKPKSYESQSRQDTQPSSPSSATIRRRSIRRRSPENELSETISSSANSTNGDKIKRQNPSILKESENFPDKGKVEEERNEESTLTTATHDEPFGDSADSLGELNDSPSNSLDYATGLVIRAIMFQIRVFIMFVKCPILLMLYTCMFFVDPFGTIRKGRVFSMRVLDRVSCCVCEFIGPSALGWFNEHKSFWNVAFRCGWGFLWSIYVCCILFALLVSALLFSGFLVKGLVEKPFQMKQVLNFDYTKHSPVAFVPIISCSGVGGDRRFDESGDIGVDRWVNKRVIPSKQKVHLTVSLLVPESGYNTKLGVFQIRVDFLSSNGKTIGSSRQPCMLRFRSEPIRLITTFLKIVPLLTGYISETQTLDAKMSDFVEGDVPTSCLKVTLEQRAEYLPGAGIPQIYDSSIFVESELPLIKRILWYWKMSLFIWIAMMAFVMELLFVLVCCWPMIIPRTRQRSGSACSTSTQNNLQPQS